MSECPQCRAPISECSDPRQPWYAQRRIDYRQMALERAKRRYERMHEKRPWHDGTFPKDPAGWFEDYHATDHPFHFDDGVTIGVSQTDDHPDDDFLSWLREEEESDGSTP